MARTDVYSDVSKGRKAWSWTLEMQFAMKEYFQAKSGETTLNSAHTNVDPLTWVFFEKSIITQVTMGGGHDRRTRQPTSLRNEVSMNIGGFLNPYQE
jgi:hypothetical protein